jgi:hypothetical protein
VIEQDLRQHVEQIGLEVAQENLKCREIGYHLNGYHDHCDIVLDNGIRLEVKASLFTHHKHSKGRYQFNTRQSPDAFVLVCVGSAGHAFVIPGEMIGDRNNVAIWSQDPTEYNGIWTPFLDAWWILGES